MLRTGDIVEHIIEIYEYDPNMRYDENFNIVGNPPKIIGEERKLAIITGDKTDLYDHMGRFNKRELRDMYAISYLDGSGSSAWYSSSNLEFVCTAKDWIIKNIK